jgi:hypothetical protein
MLRSGFREPKEQAGLVVLSAMLQIQHRLVAPLMEPPSPPDQIPLSQTLLLTVQRIAGGCSARDVVLVRCSTYFVLHSSVLIRQTQPLRTSVREQPDRAILCFTFECMSTRDFIQIAVLLISLVGPQLLYAQSATITGLEPGSVSISITSIGFARVDTWFTLAEVVNVTSQTGLDLAGVFAMDWFEDPTPGVTFDRSYRYLSPRSLLKYCRPAPDSVVC